MQSGFSFKCVPVHGQEIQRGSAGSAIFLRIEKLGEARIFLEEGEVFIVARVIAVFGAKLDGNFKIRHRRIRFAGEAIECSQRVVNVIRFR